MITRCKSRKLARGLASAGALPPLAHKTPSRAYDGKERRESSDKTQHQSTADPWAPIFDDLSTAAPPVPSRRPNLPPRFFTSRPAPKTFFSSNASRGRQLSGSGRREYVTEAGERGSSSTSKVSAWDHIFEGVDSETSILGHSAFSGSRRPKRNRPTMTAREISAFDNMFDMIFSAVNDKRRESRPLVAQPHTSSPAESVSSKTEPSPPQPSSDVTPTLSSESAMHPAPDSIEHSPSSGSFDLFGKLRRQSNRLRRTSATTELFDRQKEEMELCDTDQELFEWALREVFQSEATSTTTSQSSSQSAPSLPPNDVAQYVSSPTYPQILAHLMRLFRTKYHNPHTALAFFAHAKRRSIHSYVFGCTTPAYNELLEIRWELDGMDALKGIEEALVEMRANGVRPDKDSRRFVERVRREVGQALLARRANDGDGNVWSILERIEGLVSKKGERGVGGTTDNGKESRLDAKKRHWNEEWKSATTDNVKLGEDRLSLT